MKLLIYNCLCCSAASSFFAVTHTDRIGQVFINGGISFEQVGLNL